MNNVFGVMVVVKYILIRCEQIRQNKLRLRVR